MANSVNPDQTWAVCSGSTLFASILNSSVMLGNYLQQTTSADDIFKCIFFHGTLRVNAMLIYGKNISTFFFSRTSCLDCHESWYIAYGTQAD